MKRYLNKLKIVLQSKYLYFILVLLTSFYVMYININPQLSKYNGSEEKIVGIINYIQIEENKLSIELNAKEKILVSYYIKNEQELESIKNNYQLGNRVVVSGTFRIPSKNTFFNLFNYRNYLKSKKIYWLYNANAITKINNNIFIGYKLKNMIISRINNISNSNYLYAFILGDTSLINDNIKDSYQANGISHLFAISGMHISLFSTLILFLLNKISKNNIFNNLILILFLLMYAFLTNFTPSIMRTVILFILLFFNKLFCFNIKTIYLLILTGIFLLIYNPFYIYNTGFIFSFTITFYLIIFSDLINNHKNYFTKLLMTSFISFLASLPIVINNFFSINLLSILFNLIFVTFVSYLIFPLALITFILPIISPLFNFFINILENMSLLCSKVDFLTITLCKLNVYFMIGYYLLITLILCLFKKEKYQSILILIFVLIIHNNILIFNANPIITILDVGQGDSILIVLPYNKGNILIDTGGIVNYHSNSKTTEYSIVLNKTIPYLKSIGVKKIDYLILSHGDFDHMGESINLVNNFKIDKVIFNCGEYNDLEKEFIKVLEKEKIKYYTCIKKLNIDKYKLQFLNTGVYDNENDSSNVIYFNLNNYKFLFMGDAGYDKEKDILEKYNLNDIDFLKVGHHGSNTSSSKEFINQINPKYSLISVGKNNRYGHPKESVLDILENSKIYRTDQDGSIEIKLNKTGYMISTCPP